MAELDHDLLVLLDFDGVINALNHVREWNSESEGYDFKTTPMNNELYFATDNEKYIEGYLVQWSTELVERCNRFLSLPGVKFGVLSTWKERFGELLCPAMGMVKPDFFIPPTPESGSRYFKSVNDWSQSGKVVALKAWWKEAYGDGPYPRVLWCEDVATEPYVEDIGVPNTKNMFYRDFGAVNLVVKPNPSRGISRAEMENIEHYVFHE